jgi:hypothetical protein
MLYKMLKNSGRNRFTDNGQILIIREAKTETTKQGSEAVMNSQANTGHK